MIENWLFVLDRLETQLHDILWAVHDGKNHGRGEGEENFGELPVTVGERCTFLSYRYARVCEALALTEPEQGVERLHYRLRVTEPERSIDGC